MMICVFIDILLNVKINLVYFAYLGSSNWVEVVMEQLQSLKEIGLYDKSDNIYMSVISNDDELSKLKSIIDNGYDKIKIYLTSTENQFEYLGLRTLYEISENDSVNLYFHTKGVTSGIVKEYNHNIRRGLFNEVISKYDEIINEFEKNPKLDLSTAIPNEDGVAYYNFFWVRGDYVRNYCVEPIPNDCRFYWETWVSETNPKKENVVTFSTIIGYEKINCYDNIIELRDKYLM